MRCLSVCRFARGATISAIVAVATPKAMAQAVRVVSSTASGQFGNGFSAQGSASTDGRYVAFSSEAANFVAGDTNGVEDVFVKDTLTGLVVRVSTDSVGVQVAQSSGRSHISADGRFVVFVSSATYGYATANTPQVFRKNLATGEVALVSCSPTGTDLPATVTDTPSISDDGTLVALSAVSTGTTMMGKTVTALSNAVMVKNITTGAVTDMSLAPNGSRVPDCFNPAISGNGRYVAYESAWDARNGSAQLNVQIWLRDLQSGQAALVSASQSASDVGDGDSWRPTVSRDGRYVAFNTRAPNLIPGAPAASDQFVRKDIQTGDLITVALDPISGAFPDYSAGGLGSMSADGQSFAIISSSALGGKNPLLSEQLLLVALPSRVTVLMSHTATGGLPLLGYTLPGDPGQERKSVESLAEVPGFDWHNRTTRIEPTTSFTSG